MIHERARGASVLPGPAPLYSRLLPAGAISAR
jgi:hypothetical protein